MTEHGPVPPVDTEAMVHLYQTSAAQMVQAERDRGWDAAFSQAQVAGVLNVIAARDAQWQAHVASLLGVATLMRQKEELQDRVATLEAALARAIQFIDQELMPRYVELLEAAGIPREQSVVVEMAKALLATRAGAEVQDGV